MPADEPRAPTPLVGVAHDQPTGVVTLTLQSPANRNALSVRLLTELAAAVEDAAADPGVRVVVLAAEGPAFCSGADLSERLAEASGESGPVAGATMGPGAGATMGPVAGATMGDVLTLLAQSPRPVVAKVGGHVRAGGIGLVAACDLAVVAEPVTFAFSEVRVGVAPAIIAVPAGRVMTPRALARHALTAEPFDAAEAAACGLVTEVVPAGDLDRRVEELTASFLRASPAALAATKELLAALRGRPWHEALDEASAASARLFASADAAEGMAAFLEKRPPRWCVTP
jgi:methylglutaconyl-CoA hydratase